MIQLPDAPLAENRPPKSRWCVSAIASVFFHGAIAAAFLFFAAFSDPVVPVKAIQVSLVSDIPGAPGVQSDSAPDAVQPLMEMPPDPPPLENFDVTESVPVETGDLQADEILPPAPAKKAAPSEQDVAAVPLEPSGKIDLEEIVQEDDAVTLAPPLPKRKPERPVKPLSVAEAEIEPDDPVEIFDPDARPDRPVAKGARNQLAAVTKADAPVHPPRVKRVGGGNPPPVYPMRARRRGIEGRLVLNVKVSAQGLARLVKVKVSSGSKLLDIAAQKAVQKWRFVPAMKAKIPVPGAVDVTVVFKLRRTQDS